MNLILLRDSCVDASGTSLLSFALTGEPLAGVVLRAMGRGLRHQGKRGRNRRSSIQLAPNEMIYAAPENWEIKSRLKHQQQGNGSDAESNVIHYNKDLPFDSVFLGPLGAVKSADSWHTISNGRFVTTIDYHLIEGVLAYAEADLVAVNAKPALLGASERLKLTPDGNVAGFRRLYSDTAEFAFLPRDWPHHLFIRANVVERLLSEGNLPSSFSALVRKCRSGQLKLRAVDVGGTVLDLETAEGMLCACGEMLSEDGGLERRTGNSPSVSSNAKIIGRVLFGEDVDIGPEAVIIGPSILGDGATVETGAVVSSSVIGPEVRVPENQIVRNRIIQGRDCDWEHDDQNRRAGSSLSCDSDLHQKSREVFRHWPRLSYARCLKRIADFVAALMVLILFAPVIPFIALAIKLNSQGPVFYTDKRQGLHGKVFGCLKFRTMVTGAAQMQDKLRFVSQVDGPQFKMEDDPRISSVGRFLRVTYIDEIPQFFNVLLGQMSVVGPRPSPESENTLCPSWRDARLSVRPGITGLWQLYRTREPMRDFQEWIYYDTMYVRSLSLKMDLTICWQTAKKLLDNFISQF
jgi:lipopolysaccharide/colanic/teichoic acid biosynthesis glycosyltransferase